jgi:hypothetical protein
MRVLESEKFVPEHFYEEAAIPALKNLGVGLTTSLYAFLPAYLALVPAAILGGLTGQGVTGVPNMGPGFIAAIVIGGMIGAVWVFYILLSLLMALPHLALEESRFFQSMDQGVRKAKGNRLEMLASLIPFLLIYIVYGVGIALLPQQQLVQIVYASIGSSVLGILMFSYIYQFYSRIEWIGT